MGSKGLTATEGISSHTRSDSCRLVEPEPLVFMMSTWSADTGVHPGTPSTASAVSYTLPGSSPSRAASDTVAPLEANTTVGKPPIQHAGPSFVKDIST